MSVDEGWEGVPQEVIDSRNLSKFFANYRGAPHVGCGTASVEGGFTRITLRYPHPETGTLCSLQLRPEVVDGRPVIAMDLKERDVAYNDRGPDTDYRQ